MKATTTIAVAVAILSILATGVQAEDPVYFLDGKLKAAVQEALGVTNPTPTQMLNLTALTANYRGIANLTGIEYAVNLTFLEVMGNKISDLGPLSGLTNLTHLQLRGNQISNLSPLSGLTNIATLVLGNNPISDLSPLAGLTSLLGLKLEAILTSDISSLSGLTNLENLALGWNGITHISALSNLTKLQVLGLSGNNISDISILSGLTNLRELGLDGNKISDISPLSGLTNLDLLILRKNPLNWDSHFVHIPMIKAHNPGIDIRYDPWVDTDTDGISAAVENGAPNGGDGNDDGIPDGLQNEVASLPNAVDAGYVTLESPGGTDLVSVSATANPSSGDLPEGVEFPIGFFEFTVQGIAPGGETTVTIFTSADITTYYKYGPTPGNPTDHWYEFLYDGTTGAEILADGVILHLVDGQRGDKDLTANGEIVEPGGPGLLLNTTPVATITQAISGFVASVGVPVEFRGIIDDPDAGDTHTATWTVGGIDHVGMVSGSSVAASIQFSEAGIYSVSLTVTDHSGASDTTTKVNDMPAFIVIYDPEGGFVTGGGWIHSHEGAYAPDPSLAGKANFGFVSKYKKGATVPTGQTEFVFQAGDLNFHSSSYDWLVVTGSNYARFKGTGTISGLPKPYKFMLWAGDDDPDTFRIKIWYEEDEVEWFTVYDNGMGQAIGGGSIIVHTQ